MMREANFFLVFMGIESPDTDTLVSMQKKQNTRRNLVESIHRIYRAGLAVTAGFIVGFDTEKGNVDDAMVACIEEASIPTAMVGLLFALPNTQLTRRLQRDDRLFPENWMWQKFDTGQCDQFTIGLNFETLRPRRTVLADYKNVLDRVYAPRAYFGRIRRQVRLVDRFEPNAHAGIASRGRGRVPTRDIALLLLYLAVTQPRLFPQFALTVLACLRKPASMRQALIFAILYLHLGPFVRRASAAIGEQIAQIDRGEWHSPLLSRRQPAELMAG